MLKIYLLYPHLLATCLAIGMIVLTDLRLLAKIVGYQVVIPPPTRFETRVVAGALAVLYVTGAALIWIGLQERPDYLDNGKLQAKLALVLLLSVNAWVLHKMVFPRLERAAPVSRWSGRLRNMVSASVGLSNSVWLYAAFLGIARPWNFTKSAPEVLLIGLAVWAVLASLVRLMLQLAAVEEHDSSAGRAPWANSVKEKLSEFGALGGGAPH